MYNMHKAARSFAILAITLLACGCGRSVSEKILDEFEQVDQELTDSILTPSDLLDSKYEHLRLMACAEGRLLADSVNLLYEHASERMFALDELLAGPDVGDGNTAGGAFRPNGLGEEALQATQALYLLMEQVTAGDTASADITEIATPMKSIQSLDAWYQRDFHQAPPPVITATIERYVADMAKAKRLCTSVLLAPCDR